MKQKIPQEIDTLMWSVSESGSQAAVIEFEQRYPEFKFELGRRLAMVRELKGAKGKEEPVHVVPRFQPQPKLAPPMPSSLRNSLIAFAVVGTLALAYLMTTLLTTEAPKPDPAPSVATGEAKAPEVVYVNPKPQENPIPVNPPVTNPPKAPEGIVQVDPLVKPIDMQIELAPLKSVLKMVAESGKRKLTILDGLANPDIKVSYRGKSPVEILKDLGKQYAFTAMDQGDGSIVIVPARDEGDVDDPNLRPSDRLKPSDGNKPTSRMQ